MSDDNKFSIGDILWEYADYAPPKQSKTKRPAAAPLAPKGTTGQPGMTAPQPQQAAQPQPAASQTPPQSPKPNQTQQPAAPQTPKPDQTNQQAPAEPAATQTSQPARPASQPAPSAEPLPANQGPVQTPKTEAEHPQQPTQPQTETAPGTAQTPAQPAAPEQPSAINGQPVQGPQKPPTQPQDQAQPEGQAQPADQSQPTEQAAPTEQAQPDQAQPSQDQQPQTGVPQDDGPDLIAFTADPNAKKPDAAQAADQTATQQPLKGFGPAAGGAGQVSKGFEGFHPFKNRKAKAQPAPPPDATPAQLSLEYGAGLDTLKKKTLGTLVLTIVLTLLAFMDTGIFSFLTDLIPETALRCASLGGFLACCALAWEVLKDGLVQLTNLTPSSRTLALCASVFTLADGVTMVLTPLRDSAVSFFAPCALVLLFQLIGQYCEQSSKDQACKTAASVDQLYVVTQDANIMAGKPGFRKWIGKPKGFGSQMRTASWADAQFQKLTPVLMTACVCLALLTTVAHRQPKLVLWSLSALFTASATLGASLSLNLPLQFLSGKLHAQGVVLAGQPGLDATKGARSAVLLDGDLYPPGTVSLVKSQPLSELPIDRVLGYTAALIRASGSGLTFLFDWALRSVGGRSVPVEKIVLQDGGLIGQVQGQHVLVGNSDFMSKQRIDLPTDIKYSRCLFCAVDQELIGIFELNYTLHQTILPSLKALIAHRIAPLLATRDFNISPSRMRLSDRLPKEHLTYPDVHRRVLLSSPNQPHGQTIVALLCREGLAPFSLAIVASKRIRRASRFSSFFVRLSACMGVILTATLSSAGALSAMSAWHMTLFLLLWFVPVLFLSLWTTQY